MDSDTEDHSGDDELIEETASTALISPASPAPASPGGGGPTDDEDLEDWELVLAKVARDTATTKILVAVLLVVVVVSSLVFGFLVRNDNSSTKSASTTTSTTSPASTATTLESSAGKPCVALSDPLPAGAPTVDVAVGPPPTSLVTKDIKEGTGAEVTSASTVTVNYVGVACSTGKVFDSSYATGKAVPVSFPVAQVIPGFGKGVTGMKVGGVRLIGIPGDQAYGAQGQGTIAPDEALWFVVEVTAVTP